MNKYTKPVVGEQPTLDETLEAERVEKVETKREFRKEDFTTYMLFLNRKPYNERSPKYLVYKTKTTGSGFDQVGSAWEKKDKWNNSFLTVSLEKAKI